MPRPSRPTIEWVESTISTNDFARDPRFGHGDTVAAEAQTAGRGQQGNVWHSEPGANLTFSTVIEPLHLHACDQFQLLRAVSLAVTDTLEGMGLRSSIKWPNDIYVGDNKISGLLIENDIHGAQLSRAIAGIGLNVNQTAFPSWIPNPTSILTELRRKTPDAPPLDRKLLLKTISTNLIARCSMLDNGNASLLEADYRRLLYRLDVPAKFKIPGSDPFVGIIREVAPSGELTVEHLPEERKHTYIFKEIEFIIT